MDKVKLFFEKIAQKFKDTLKNSSISSILLTILVSILGIAMVIIGFSIVVGLVIGAVWFILSLPWHITEIILDTAKIDHRHFSDGESVVAGIVIYVLLFVAYFILHWLFTGRPAFIAILSRIICLLGLVLGVLTLFPRVRYTLNEEISDNILPIAYEAINNPIQVIGISIVLGLVSELIGKKI